MADYQTELSQSGTTLYLKAADGLQRSTVFGDSASDTHHFTGSVYVSGTLHANTYQVNQIDTSHGDTSFGNDSGDTHTFLGTVNLEDAVNIDGSLSALGSNIFGTAAGAGPGTTTQFSGSSYFGGNVSSSAEGQFATGLTTGGDLTVLGSSILGDNSSDTHQITGSAYFSDKVDVAGNLTSTKNTSFGDSPAHVHSFTGSAYFGGNVSSSAEGQFATGLTTGGDLTSLGSSVFGDNSSDTHQVTGSVYFANDLSGSGEAQFGGTLTTGGNLSADGGITTQGSSILGATPGGTHQVTGSTYFKNDVFLANILHLQAQTNVSDDQKLYFGSDSDISLEYDENGTDHFRIVAPNTTIDGTSLTITGSTTVVGAISGSTTLSAAGSLYTNSSKFKVEADMFMQVSATLTGSLSIADGNTLNLGTNYIVNDAGETYPLQLSGSKFAISGPTKFDSQVIVSTKADHVGKTAFEVHHTGTLDPTTLANDTGGGEVVYFGSGSLSAGALYYLNTDGGWDLANAAAVGSLGTAGAGNASLLGIPLGSNPYVDGVLVRGYFDANTYFTGTWVKGQAVYIYAGATGKMTSTAPAVASNYVRIIGWATDQAKVIYFSPDSNWVEIA